MEGKFIDIIRLGLKKNKLKTSHWSSNIEMLQTTYGKLRVLDTKTDKPIIINAPDGPNVIEHQVELINALSKNFRVICFEFPGLGFSYPSKEYDYTVKNGAETILNLMEVLKIDKAFLSMSCSNGFYGMKASEIAPQKISHLFLSQTPANHCMKKWVKHNIPKPFTYPVIGEFLNSLTEKKSAKIWYNKAYPEGRDNTKVIDLALNTLDNGGCFCLSGLVQGLNKDIYETIKTINVPTTLVWGNKDYSHRDTNFSTIKEHIPNCNIIEFEGCGHFPELENTEKYVSLINTQLNQ